MIYVYLVFFSSTVMLRPCMCVHVYLVHSQNCDGGIGCKFDSPVFDQVRVQDTGFKHVLHNRAVSLETITEEKKQILTQLNHYN